MNRTSPHALCQVVDELLMLCSESAEFHQTDDVRAVFQESLQVLGRLRRRLQHVHRAFVVGFVGLSNVGKSTLLNALLGRELAPRRNGPCTSAPIEFTHGDRWRVRVEFRKSAIRRSFACAGVEDVHRHLAELATEANSADGRSIRRVTVEAPCPLLQQHLVIADTPGFGAAQTGDEAGSHEQSLREYLQERVSQVFWIVLADQGIGHREREFHDRFLVDVCDTVVVTGSEEWDAADRARFADRFGHRLPRFHFASGLVGLESRRTNDLPGLEAAGITPLERRIRELADPAGRLAAARCDLLQWAEDLGYWLREYRDGVGKPLRRHWRPDSWMRFGALRLSDTDLVDILLTCLRPR